MALEEYNSGNGLHASDWFLKTHLSRLKMIHFVTREDLLIKSPE